MRQLFTFFPSKDSASASVTIVYLIILEVKYHSQGLLRTFGAGICDSVVGGFGDFDGAVGTDGYNAAVSCSPRHGDPRPVLSADLLNKQEVKDF